MNELLTAFLDSHTKTEPSEREYLSDDGLFHCKKCHTPTQCRIRIGDRERIVSCTCKCQQEELAQRKREQAKAEHLDRIRRLKSNGIQEKTLSEWTFACAADTDGIRFARRYVEHWAEAKQNNLGLLLWGDVGTGKSFAAACIANALLESGVPVLMTNFSKILNQMGSMYSEERYRYIASFNAYDLLIIDDLGIERSTEYALEQVYAVIDERYKAKKPLIITTNQPLKELRNPDNLAYARIYSRVLELCTPVKMHGTDRRTEMANTKKELIRDLLCEE